LPVGSYRGEGIPRQADKRDHAPKGEMGKIKEGGRRERRPEGRPLSPFIPPEKEKKEEKGDSRKKEEEKTLLAFLSSSFRVGKKKEPKGEKERRTRLIQERKEGRLGRKKKAGRVISRCLIIIIST